MLMKRTVFIGSFLTVFCIGADPVFAQSATRPSKGTTRPVVIEGNVTDAVTHQLLKDFTVSIGIQAHPSLEPGFNTARGFHDGHYSVEVPQGSIRAAAWYVRIEASNYAPMDSDPLHDSATADFQLQPGTNLTGRVVGSNGAPVPDVTVSLIQRGQPQLLLNGKVVVGPRSATTDKQGRYEFPPQSDRFLLMAVGSSGFAYDYLDDPSAHPELKLAPWGRVEGRVMSGDKPAAGLDINIQGLVAIDPTPVERNVSRLEQESWTKTGADGRFVIEHLAPGEIRILSSKKKSGLDGPNETESSLQMAAVVEPGATVKAAIGGTGRPVVGKLILPDELNGKRNWNALAGLNTMIPSRPIAPNYLRMTAVEREQWIFGFDNTDSGNAYKQVRLAALNYAFTLNPDGSYRIEDVPPGNYEIRFTLIMYGGRDMGTTLQQITVPPSDAPRSDEALELPDIIFKPR